MTGIPSQGFRHAAALLLANRIRDISAERSADAIRSAVERLAHELIALAEDMHVRGGASQWLINELDTTIQRLPHVFNRDEVRQVVASIVKRVPLPQPNVEPLDLFLVYVPEDRLPLAAPLAIELVKRRVTIAIAEYEVTTAEHTTAALAYGLAHHRGGVLLLTQAFERTQPGYVPSAHDRVRVITDPQVPETVQELAAFAIALRRSVGK